MGWRNHMMQKVELLAALLAAAVVPALGGGR